MAMAYPNFSAPPPPPYTETIDYITEQNLQKMRDTRLETFIGEYKISDYFAQKIKLLKGFDIVLVLDDSGSMNGMIEDEVGNVIDSRWTELRKRVEIIIDLSTHLDQDGIDIHFLNNGSFNNVKDPRFIDVCPVFNKTPQGVTPLETVCQNIFMSATEKPTLMIIMTDGLPSDARGQTTHHNMENFKAIIRSRPKNYNISFGACTSDDNIMKYLNSFDDIDGVDVVDDYISERHKIQRIQGKSFPFTFGDYIMKTMLGSIDKQTDMLDEVPLERRGCVGCTIC